MTRLFGYCGYLFLLNVFTLAGMDLLDFHYGDIPPSRITQKDYFAELIRGCPQLNEHALDQVCNDSCYFVAVRNAVEQSFVKHLSGASSSGNYCVQRHADRLLCAMPIQSNVDSQERTEIKACIRNAIDQCKKDNERSFIVLYRWACQDGRLKQCCSSHIESSISRAAFRWAEKLHFDREQSLIVKPIESLSTGCIVS